jgi:hypothetical protein
VIGIAATVGVVAADRDLALVIQEAIKDMQGFARRRRDHLGVKRGEAVGEVGIELASPIVAVMGIEAPGGVAETAGAEELPVRGGGKTAPEDRRQRLALLLIDKAPQGNGIGFVTNRASARPVRLSRLPLARSSNRCRSSTPAASRASRCKSRTWRSPSVETRM